MFEHGQKVVLSDETAKEDELNDIPRGEVGEVVRVAPGRIEDGVEYPYLVKFRCELNERGATRKVYGFRKCWFAEWELELAPK